ncbi:hypothetical protein GCM10007063_33490 [Lentibacillus kapialis]|uniref:Uncharacterized protein n=1 Tax=Lentibacillus kapialis TaxID=340214 RepID=A0A917Q2V8_9BACI|nr:hypothetical protein GCM10007063_33490 [Lentibacillus kapialis]
MFIIADVVTNARDVTPAVFTGGLEGYLVNSVNYIERVFFFISAVLLMYPSTIAASIGIFLLLALYLLNYLKGLLTHLKDSNQKGHKILPTNLENGFSLFGFWSKAERKNYSQFDTEPLRV